ncbi:hypothetical protein [Paenibacillus tyrfis]|uniref:hypothetical protein n=1 Tax=Paenibacillus tyrfis TaxID=1501230 RepID=UPI00209C8B2B|nr:hypothetical protein [Paenibacillus tyrfis]MCP1310938.1 hypothetical protein [Paenibacillus tyrfis]
MNKRIRWLLVFLLTAGPWLGSFAYVRAEPEGSSSLTVVSVSGGMAHTLAVMSDGTVRA